MSEIRHSTGLKVDDESWTWSDLAHELADNFNKNDLEELIGLLVEYKSLNFECPFGKVEH